MRTLFIVVTLFSAASAYIGDQAQIVRERAAMCREIEEELHGKCFSPQDDSPPRDPNVVYLDPTRCFAEDKSIVSPLRRLLGDQPVKAVVLPHESDARARKQVRSILPEATLYFELSNSYMNHYHRFSEDEQPEPE